MEEKALSVSIEGLIASLGFPTAITVWLLYERNKTLKELMTIVQNNTNMIEKACDALKEHDK